METRRLPVVLYEAFRAPPDSLRCFGNRVGERGRRHFAAACLERADRLVPLIRIAAATSNDGIEVHMRRQATDRTRDFACRADERESYLLT